MAGNQRNMTMIPIRKDRLDKLIEMSKDRKYTGRVGDQVIEILQHMIDQEYEQWLKQANLKEKGGDSNA